MDYLGINIHKEDPAYVNEFSKSLFSGFYLREGETIPEALARASVAFSAGDNDLAQRIYDAAYKGWFMFASPILSNAPLPGEKVRGMPISCFLQYIGDSIKSQVAATSEMAHLSVLGGGDGLHNGIRATSDKAPGPIPYMKTLDATIGYYQQGRTRRGACAYYMDVDHPSIIEHIKFRIPGGDSSRKATNVKQFHTGVNVSQAFINAIEEDMPWELICPHTKEVKEVVKARDIWETILETRALTGEPYIFKIDTANEAMPQSQKDKGLRINGSNICIEITLPTSEERTAVCCLSSLNVELYDEWKDTSLVADLTEYLDNVLSYFISHAPPELSKAIFSASQERAIGIGTMGWHYYLQRKGIAWETGGVHSAVQHSHKIYSDIKEKAKVASYFLGSERGEAPDMVGTGLRNSNLLAIAPNSNNAVLLQTSPSIEPISSNAYSHTTRAGTFLVKNKYLAKFLEAHAEFKEEGWLRDQWDSIIKEEGSVQHLSYLTDMERALFKTAKEIDQHWIIELAENRQKYICQSQSLNLFFVSGCDRGYMNSVHMKALRSPSIKSLYYCRMSKESGADIVREVERKALKDWNTEECVSCSG